MKSADALSRSYFIGFGLSIVLTLAAFLVTKQQVDSEGRLLPELAMMVALVVLAISQLVVQLLYFFHLGKEAKPRLNLVSFLFMLMVVGIVGFGSIWIMYNLNYNMHGKEVETYIQNEENIKPADGHSHSH